MTSDQKQQLAMEFIRQVRDMKKESLNRLILRDAGEDLAQFFLSYSAMLIKADPQKASENASSLLLMGYLIRAAEERQHEEVVREPAAASAGGYLH